jgi:Rieske [2Fe-2S] domain
MSEFNAVFGGNELQEGAMRAVEVEGVPVLVSRSEGGETCAIANTCTHKGRTAQRGRPRRGRGYLPLAQFSVRPVLRGSVAGTCRRAPAALRDPGE